MDIYYDIQNLVYAMEEDIEKFYDKQNNSAGKRAKKQCKELMRLSLLLLMDIDDNILHGTSGTLCIEDELKE